MRQDSVGVPPVTAPEFLCDPRAFAEWLFLPEHEVFSTQMNGTPSGFGQLEIAVTECKNRALFLIAGG